MFYTIYQGSVVLLKNSKVFQMFIFSCLNKRLWQIFQMATQQKIWYSFGKEKIPYNWWKLCICQDSHLRPSSQIIAQAGPTQVILIFILIFTLSVTSNCVKRILWKWENGILMLFHQSHKNKILFKNSTPNIDINEIKIYSNPSKS